MDVIKKKGSHDWINGENHAKNISTERKENKYKDYSD